MKRGIQHNTHPGELLCQEVKKANNLTVVKASQLLKVTRPTLSKILNGRSAITPNMAIRITKVFGGNPDLWLRLQANYELKEAEKEFQKEPLNLERYIPEYLVRK